MISYPLPSISLEEAQSLQFKVVDAITREFAGHEILSLGDLGIVPEFHKPEATFKAEKVIARVFGAESAVLVRGAGTDAIADALFAVVRAGETLLVHTGPIYTTTKTTLVRQGIRTVAADFNDLSQIRAVMEAHPEIKAALVQYTRQSMHDSYDIEQVISTIKQCRPIPVVTDDNYAVMKVPKIGTQCGADLSCFSTFKLLGPEGIGCVVGNRYYIDFLSACNYSGGSQVQGHEAMEVLRGLTYAPVAFAIQSSVNARLEKRLRSGEVPGIKDAFIASAQSRVLLVEFEKPIALQVLKEAEKLGAASYPVGSESRYELAPMFYRISGTFRSENPDIAERMIRINPMRSGDDTVIRILKEAIKRAN